jgi:hypothetical protein
MLTICGININQMAESVYEVQIQTQHPDLTQVKMIYTQDFIDVFINGFFPLKEAIETQRDRTGGKTCIMYLLGDHIISYNEVEGEFEKLIFFLPLNLSEADIELIFESDYYVPLYQSIVSLANQSDYSGGTIKFVTVGGK